MTTERAGGTTIKGNPLTVMGDVLSVGDTAPEFTVTANDMSQVSLSDSSGKVRLISVVPSLDTGICDAQTRRFSEETMSLPIDVEVYTISAEHPFNQKRWCGAVGIDRMQVLSDHMDMNFGESYGLAIKEWRLLQRAIFVVGKDDKITYTEYVPEIASHPDYDAALSAVLKATLG